MDTSGFRRLAGSVTLVAALLCSSADLLAGAEGGAELLQRMVGSWRVEVELQTPNGEVSGTGEATVRLGPGGRSLVMDYRGLEGPMASFALHQIVTWNEDESEFTLIWVDSRNSGATVVNGEQHGEEFRFDRAADEGGATMFRSTYADLREDSFEARSYVLSGDSARPVMTLKYSRVD